MDEEIADDYGHDEPNPEDLYIEEQMKRDIAEFYRRKYPKLKKFRGDE